MMKIAVFPKLRDEVVATMIAETDGDKPDNEDSDFLREQIDSVVGR